MMQKAALYLRSSKDRSDVSIDAQRRQLQEMAAQRGIQIVAEFSDVVESGKDDQRAGFQSMVMAVRDRSRGWDTLLILDTSRLARRRHIALIFEESECKKQGVRVIYKSLPDSDPITEMLLKSILQAMDEWHSLTSRQKGMAGMAENVRQGWRAGGRAPMGYMLEHVETGAFREGIPVRKSRLVLGDDAEKIQVFLKSKAAGMSRRLSLKVAGLSISDSTAIGLEWNAYTYAGHTVWNQRNETVSGAYVGGIKRKPRDEWVIQRSTHVPLISDIEAESLITALEKSARSSRRRTKSEYLLSGVLVTPDGAAWHGDGEGYYRVGKGRRYKSARVESAVLAQLGENLKAGEFVSSFTAAIKANASQKKKDVELPKLRKEMTQLENQIFRITGLLGKTSTPEPLLRQIELYEVRHKELKFEIENRAEIEADADKINSITELQVSKLMRGLAEDMELLDRDRLKDFVCGLIEKIELDAINNTFQLTYRLSAGDKVASPRGFEPRLPP